jgi:hypothetical protein
MERSAVMLPSESFIPEEPCELLAGYLPWLVEQTRDGICLIDAAGCCTFANRSAARLLDTTPGELLQRRLHDILHAARPGRPVCSPEGCPLFACLRAELPSCRWRDLFRRQDGTLLPVECVFRPIGSEAQAGGGLLLFSEAVTSDPAGGVPDGSPLVGAVSAARDAERQALACELHDGLAQVLTSARAHLDVYRLAYDGEDPEKAARALARTMEFVKESVAEVRRLIKALRVAERPPSDEAKA